MSYDLENLFAPDVITHYPEGLTPVNLTHSYSDERLNSRGKLIDFQKVSDLLIELKRDVFGWYRQETGSDIDTYNLGDMRDAVHQRFWEDSRFLEALDILELEPAQRRNITIPWWNEIAAGEVYHEIYLDGKTVHVKFRPRHSYETQFVRAGLERPVRNASVGGLILTSPEPESPDGFLTIGLRGGSSYPNTYHVNAGALRITDSFRNGLTTIYDVFREYELVRELGIDDGIESASAFSRIDDQHIEKGPMYLFAVRTGLSRDGVLGKWSGNRHKDKHEHKSLVFIPANPDSVNAFIRAHYRGVVENRNNRNDSERFLLHPAALALASFSGMKIEELGELYQEGVW